MRETLTPSINDRQCDFEMNPESLASLTARQRECLRLVSRDRDAKEIGRILNISPETVNTHLKAAMSKLGINSRFVAARALAELEGGHQPVVTPPSVIDPISPADTTDAFYIQADVEPDRLSVQELHTPFDVFGQLDEGVHASLPQGAFRNDLTKSRRLLLTGVTTALMFLGCFAAAAMIYTVQGIIQSPPPTIPK